MVAKFKGRANYPTVLCNRSATPRVHNGSQIPRTWELIATIWRVFNALQHDECEISVTCHTRKSFANSTRRFRADFTQVFKIFKGVNDLSPPDFILHLHYTASTQPSSMKKRCFYVRVVKYWNRLSASIVMLPSAPAKMYLRQLLPKISYQPVSMSYSYIYQANWDRKQWLILQE